MFNTTPLLRIIARRRVKKLSSLDPVKAQEETLKSLIKTASSTKFGRDHAFSEITSVQQFQKKVPLRKYEDFWREYWEPMYPRLTDCTWPGLVPFFCVSSGTSLGATKNIPCTNEMVASNTKAGLDLLCWHLHNRPDSKIGAGSTFFLGGSTALTQVSEGVFSGDLSGIQALKTPWWIKSRYFPPRELALLSNWNEKIERLSRESLTHDVRLLGGVPSWLLIFIDALAKDLNLPTPRLKDIYPNLEMLVHGGVHFGPYKEQFDTLMAGNTAETREVYPASEGFIALADRRHGEGLRLNLDHNLFFEFVPLAELNSPQPTRHWVKTIETGVNYAVILTTCSGLWSYVIGDTVTFVETAPPRLLITGRTSYMLSAFGEHLIGIEIEESVTRAAREHGLHIVDFSVGALYPSSTEALGGHLYVVECAEAPSKEAFDAFLRALDALLLERNEDYCAHRAEGFGLNPPKGLAVLPGTFRDWMAQRGKLGGQNKVPRIINDQELFQALRSYGEERRVF
jgi:hypothetical protein